MKYGNDQLFVLTVLSLSLHAAYALDSGCSTSSALTGDLLETINSIDTSESCGALCFWSEQCIGFNFDLTSKDCSLYSELYSCDTISSATVSGFSGYDDYTGVALEWNLTATSDGKELPSLQIGLEKGTELDLKCALSNIDKFFTAPKTRWVFREAGSQYPYTAVNNGSTLSFGALEKNNQGSYLCEVVLFSDDLTPIAVQGPPVYIDVWYMEGNFKVAPSKTSVDEGDAVVIMECTPPNSNPAAVVNWYKGNPSQKELVSDIDDLSFVIRDNDLIILSPQKDSAKGLYQCQAENPTTGSIELSNFAMLNVKGNNGNNGNTVNAAVGECPPTHPYPYSSGLKCCKLDREKDGNDNGCDGGVLSHDSTCCYGDEFVACPSLSCVVEPTGMAWFTKYFPENGLDASLVSSNQGLTWDSDRGVFQCYIVTDNTGTGDITWTVDGNVAPVIGETHLSEGGQVLVFDKTPPTPGTTVTCSTGVGTGATFTAIVPQLDSPLPTSPVRLFLGNVTGAKEHISTLFPSLQTSSNGNFSISEFILLDSSQKIETSLFYLAVTDFECSSTSESWLRADISIPLVKGGDTASIPCPINQTVNIRVRCSYHQNSAGGFRQLLIPYETCPLWTLTKAELTSATVTDPTTISITIGGVARLIPIEKMFSALAAEPEYYSSPDLITTTLTTLSALGSSSHMESIEKYRIRQWRVQYMEYWQKAGADQSVSKFVTENVTTILWSVSFPLTKPAILTYKNEELNVMELSVELPVALNSIMGSSSHPFLVSLYREGGTGIENLERGVSRVIDVEPPTHISGLNTSQEIVIGIKVPSSLAPEDLECHWYDAPSRLWVTDGLTDKGVNEEGLFECSTNHLTAFSILMTTEALQNGIHDQILSYTSYSLLGLSSLALIATLIALVSFREIRKSYNTKIHISLTAVLLAGNTVFIAGIERVENSTICTGVAIALHYIWLCVFGWTLAESYNMYLLFIRILNVHSPKFVLKLAVPAMCIPMVVVAVSVGMSPGSYGTDQYCALHGDVVYYGFAIPIGLVVVINTAIFCLVLSKIFKKTQYQNFDGRVQKALSQIKAIVTLSCLLGLTWVFGFLTFRSEVDLVFHYLFIICNGLQGVVIFICHVAIKPDVRHIWMTFLCNGDAKSAHGSRTTTPTRSRGGFRGGGAMNSRTSLFSEFFTKRSSTVTLSTTATKLSLTKQLTRQRTESLGSLNIAGVMHQQGPRKSLAPLEEKESSATNPVSTPGSTNNTVLVNGKLVLKPMLSNHSCDEMFEHIVPESTTFLASVQDPTSTPSSRGGLPRNLSSSDRLSQLSSPASNTSIHSINKKRISVVTAEITRRSSVDHVRGEKVVFTGVKLEDRLMVHQHRPPSAGKGNRVSPTSMDDERRSEERKKVILEKLQQLDEFIF